MDLGANLGNFVNLALAQHPDVRVIALGVADELMMQAPRAEQLVRQGLTALGIAARVRAALPLGSMR